MASAPVRADFSAARSRLREVEEDVTEDGARRPLIAVAMARAIAAVVYTAFCLNSLLFVVDSGKPAGAVVLSLGYLLVLLALQWFYLARKDTNYRSPLTYLALAAQAALVYLPLLQFGEPWIGLPSLLAATVLLVLPAAVAWPASAAVILSTGWIELGINGSMLVAMTVVLANYVVALELYGLTLLARQITELHTARSELANSAVAHERLRFARDLHDLLGLSLSAIAPKGELAYRLIRKAPERARRELSEILEIARRALSDVRSVARDYRELNLDEASRTAESVLAASAVDVRMELNHGELRSPVRTLLAAVLREGVTNVLLHSRAERCEIILRQAGDTVSLDIVNDGIDEGMDVRLAEDPVGLGGGIAKLNTSVVAAGGSLRAGLDADGRFRLHVTAPASRRSGATRADSEQLGRTRHKGVLLAWALATIVFCSLIVLHTLRLAQLTEDSLQITVGATLVSAMVAIQLFYFCKPDTRLRSPLSLAILLVEAAILYLPVALYDRPWVALPGILVAGTLMALPPVLAWPAFGAVLGSVALVQVAYGASFVLVAFNVGGALISGLAVFGLTWMVRAVAELSSTRNQLAQAAVAEERLRFARDLHDLLGLSLSAIALKSELAHRLVIADPQRAGEQLTEILLIARLALADVPAVAGGYRELSLEEEFQSAQSLLSAVDVDVRLAVDSFAKVPEKVGTVLATVLREGVTNVLRHSKGDWCEISMYTRDGVVVLDILNDGVTEAPEVTRRGNGIHNLSARLAKVGGELIAGLESEGTFRLKAIVPL